MTATSSCSKAESAAGTSPTFAPPPSQPTRETLLSLVDDVELICRELLENLIAPKPKRLSAANHDELTKLLLAKDGELQSALSLAGEQGEIEKKIRGVQEELERQDAHIGQLQKQLKDAETLLSTSIYQAKLKLSSIERAKKMPVPAEDLIKYGHRISASNAVSAPLNWQQGDPRRPYPTDIEMRLGFLARPESAIVAEQQQQRLAAAQQQQAAMAAAAAAAARSSMHQHSPMHDFSPFGHHGSPSKHGMIHHPQSQQGATGGGGFAWNSSTGDVGMVMKDGSHIPIEHSGGAKADEVEVMSTDSSSSSSTDSN